MNVLIVQFVPPSPASPPLANFRQVLGVAVAGIRAEGIDVRLLAMIGYNPSLLRSAVHAHRPTHVLIEIPPAALTAARHTIVELGERHFLPTIVVGDVATSRPEQAVSIPGVTAVVCGEFDRAAPELLLALREGSGAETVAGAWIKAEDGLARNAPAEPAADLDALPLADREVFDTARAIAATGEAPFAAARGCGRWCAYCLNDWYLQLHEDPAGNRRRRSVGNVLAEIEQVLGRYGGVRRVVFLDHAFADDADWLAEFAPAYAARFQQPIRCHVRLDTLTDRSAEALAAARCDLAEIEIGSGSSFIREEVLGLKLRREQIVAGVAALRRGGVGIRAGVFIGAPYESEISVEETLDLVAALKPAEVRPRVYYPVAGTRAAEIASENGWISGRGEENFHLNRSVLDMPGYSAARINETAEKFQTLVRRRSGSLLSRWWRRLRDIGRRPVGLSSRPRARP